MEKHRDIVRRDVATESYQNVIRIEHEIQKQIDGLGQGGIRHLEATAVTNYESCMYKH